MVVHMVSMDVAILYIYESWLHWALQSSNGYWF